MSALIPRRIPHLQKPEGVIQLDKAIVQSGGAWLFRDSVIDLSQNRFGSLADTAQFTTDSDIGRVLDPGSNGHANAGYGINLSGLHFTIIARLRTTSLSGAIATNLSSSQFTGWELSNSEGGAVPRTLNFYDGAWKNSGIAINDGVTHLCAVTFDGTQYKFYVDRQTSTVADTTGPGSQTRNITFGERIGTGNFPNTFGSNGASIDYVIIEDRVWPDSEIFALVDNPYSWIKPRRRWVPVVIEGGAGATVSVGLATELSTALAISRRKQKAVGLSAETDTALATTPAKVTAIGLSTEIDTAFSILRSKIKTTGLSNETDSAFALIISSAVNVGLSDETDSALAISRLKQNPVGLSTETDSALSIGRSKIKIAGLGIETDVAFTTTWEKLKSVGLSSELDEALAISSSGSLAVGLASELDVALVIGRLKQQALGIPTETDTSQPVGKIKTQQAGLSVESDTALDVTSSSGRVVGLATETDLAQSISRIKKKLIGLAPETDVALAVTIAGVTVVINTSAKETLKLLAENPTLTLSAENATLTLT